MKSLCHAGTPSFLSDISATRVAANGDQIHLGNLTGDIIDLNPLTIEGEFDFVGGTGRFTGVSGHLTWRADQLDGVEQIAEIRRCRGD